jgi:hypothetical protein
VTRQQVRYLGSEGAAAAAGGGEMPLVRNTDPEFATDFEVRFSDGFPLLLANQVII